MKSISFNGIACEDIVMHLAKLLTLSGVDTVIVDENDNYSFSEIPVIDKIEDTNFHGVFLINGGKEKPPAKNTDIKILVTDVQPVNARALRRMFWNDEFDIVIVRNVIGNAKVGAYILNIMNLKSKLICIEEKDKDLEIRCCLQEGMRYRLKSLGKGMISAVAVLACEVTGMSAKEARKALRKERKWV